MGQCGTILEGRPSVSEAAFEGSGLMLIIGPRNARRGAVRGWGSEEVRGWPVKQGSCNESDPNLVSSGHVPQPGNSNHLHAGKSHHNHAGALGTEALRSGRVLVLGGHLTTASYRDNDAKRFVL